MRDCEPPDLGSFLSQPQGPSRWVRPKTMPPGAIAAIKGAKRGADRGRYQARYGAAAWKVPGKPPSTGCGKLYKARSRLYRNEILQVNMRLKALVEIYTMHCFALL